MVTVLHSWFVVLAWVGGVVVYTVVCETVVTPMASPPNPAPLVISDETVLDGRGDVDTERSPK